MILKYIDKAIDRSTFLLFNKFRKVGRRVEFTFHTVYRDWLLYASRRSKDKNVKITMIIMTYFTFVAFRTITYFITLTPPMQPSLTYRSLIQRLDKYNEHGTINFEEIEEDQTPQLTQEQGENHMNKLINSMFK
jgi:hypothetical protein